MSAEKLPPDGYELGPGWLTTGTGECLKAGHRDPDRRVRAPYIRDDGLAVCPEHAEEAVAIVRKAAPVCCPRGCKGLNGQHEVFCPGNDETRAANAIARMAEAPTRAETAGTIAATRAPRPPEELVGALQDRCHQAIHKEAADRISALEAEVAARLVERDGWMEAAAKSEREKGALEAELAEAKRGTLVVAETAYEATQVAVRAERELWKARIRRFREDGHMLQSDLFAYLDSDGNEEADRIKNGDPAP